MCAKYVSNVQGEFYYENEDPITLSRENCTNVDKV